MTQPKKAKKRGPQRQRLRSDAPAGFKRVSLATARDMSALPDYLVEQAKALGMTADELTQEISHFWLAAEFAGRA